MAAIYDVDFEVEQGADFNFVSLPYLVNGSPFDLTGAHARMMGRPTVDSSDVLFSLTDTADDSGSVIPNGTAGTVTIWIAKVVTLGLGIALGRHDVMIDLPSGQTLKFLSGRLLVGRSATR